MTNEQAALIAASNVVGGMLAAGYWKHDLATQATAMTKVIALDLEDHLPKVEFDPALALGIHEENTAHKDG